jgi:hypothetical protein
MELSQLIDILGENTTITLAGLLIGTLFGLFAQRSRFCMRSAVVEFWNRQGTAKLAIWLCAFSPPSLPRSFSSPSAGSTYRKPASYRPPAASPAPWSAACCSASA